MSKKSMKPVSLVVGTAFVTSLATGHLSANTGTSPFAMNELSGGYMQLADAGNASKSGQEEKPDGKKSEKEGKCGEGKCGGKMKKDMEDKGDANKSDKEDTKK
ncbi:hypothetical protein C8R34_10966 [Nitrosomonas sp. Nm84]|uniref:HvfA family oxazolone/thioamide-modified RiPP metallophore n=1 Tax=Nitrosomonas sp. Nm84 TaxID=200124 RepID=UPI000D754534|nr:hypothetical protein [Nitrosomonas sp. Nm84]PXW87818.1 hypothetical protein C8R34_10966 [Nitrosomonas sp. Nm84]